MLGVKVGVNGRIDLQHQLDKLKKKASRGQLTKALVAGAVVFQHAIQERTPVRANTISGTALLPGALREDIRITVLPGTTHEASVIVGPSAKTKSVMRDLEYGHRIVSKLVNVLTRRKVPSTKFVPAHPVMRPAYEASRDEAMRAVIKTLKEEMGE